MNTSESDLQKAINEIARGHSNGMTGGAPAAVAPVVPTSYAAADEPVATVPVSADEPVATVPVSAGVPTPTAMPVSDEALPATKVEVVEVETMTSDDVRDKAIDELKPIIGTVDLKPILGKVDLLPETKFKILKEIIETTRDQEALPMAYKTAKEITNDTARAEALLYVVEIVDRLG